jgi:hypothetical protein
MWRTSSWCHERSSSPREESAAAAASVAARQAEWWSSSGMGMVAMVPFLTARRKDATDPGAGMEPFMREGGCGGSMGGERRGQIGKFLVARDAVLGFGGGGQRRHSPDS